MTDVAHNTNAGTPVLTLATDLGNAAASAVSSLSWSPTNRTKSVKSVKSKGKRKQPAEDDDDNGDIKKKKKKARADKDASVSKTSKVKTKEKKPGKPKTKKTDSNSEVGDNDKDESNPRKEKKVKKTKKSRDVDRSSGSGSGSGSGSSSSLGSGLGLGLDSSVSDVAVVQKKTTNHSLAVFLSATQPQQTQQPLNALEQELMNRYFVDFNDPQDQVKEARLVYRGYPFVCNMTSGVILQKLFSGVKPVLANAPITFSPKGISMSTYDKSNAALISIHLRAADIENFYCPETFTMCFNMETFPNNFADLEQPSQTLTMKCNSSDWLDFEIDSPDTGGVYKYRENAVSDDLQPEEVPKLLAPFRVKFPVEVLQKACQNLGQHSPNDRITFVASNQWFKFKVDEHKEQVYYRSPDNEMHFDQDSENNQRQLETTFNLSYLKRFVSIMTKLKQPITISFEEDSALYIKQDIGTVGYIRYIIAKVSAKEEP